MTKVIIIFSVDIPCNVLQTNRSFRTLGVAKPHNLPFHIKMNQDCCEVDLNMNLQ